MCLAHLGNFVEGYIFSPVYTYIVWVCVYIYIIIMYLFFNKNDIKHAIIDGHYQTQTLSRKIVLAVVLPAALSVWTHQVCKPQKFSDVHRLLR